MPKTTNPVTRKDGVSVNVILTTVVVVAAVAIIGGVLLFSGGGTPSGENNSKPVAAQLLRKPDSNTVIEAPNASVTVVEFLDYQCPACQMYYEHVTTKIEKEYQGRITLVTRNFPIVKAHPLAIPAAKAAEAAAMQGKYKEMYDKLYQNWKSWAVNEDVSEVLSDEQKANETFERYAREIGLDMQKFRTDRDSQQVEQRIDRDMKDGDRAGVNGTPTLFVNGKEFDPGENATADVTLDKLREEIDRELQKQ